MNFGGAARTGNEYRVKIVLLHRIADRAVAPRVFRVGKAGKEFFVVHDVPIRRTRWSPRLFEVLTTFSQATLRCCNRARLRSRRFCAKQGRSLPANKLAGCRI